jgi:D-beta-D-heptose 7-phosphate kinase/D-beta-D-heptose 1-phosphate adenosyltransferase
MTPRRPESKLCTVDDLLGRHARPRNHRLVFTNGCFDLLHRGHVTYLARARELGDVLVVGVNSDASVRRLKGPGRPVNREEDRAYVLAGLESVDHVVVFGEDTPQSLICLLLPDVLVKGGDYRVEDVVGAPEVEAAGGCTVLISFVDGQSTTSMLQRSQATDTVG